MPSSQEIDVAVLTGVRELKVLKRHVSAPGPGQVQLQIGAVGICGSDMAYWSKGVAGGFVPLDFTEKGLLEGYCGRMGHECAGTVVALGKDVQHLIVGDRVAVEAGVPCADCKYCRIGRYNLCKSMQFIGSAVNKVPGAMCTVFNHSASYCHKLPSHLSLQEGAMLEPMCVALSAVKRARVRMGQHVLVTGAGPVGLLTALCAKAAGAVTVTITDVVDSKLKKALEIGVDFAVKSTDKNAMEKMEKNIGGKFDKCFECCGVRAALDTCVKACASGGTLCVVANLGSTSTPFMLQEAARREIDIVGVYRYCNLYPTALGLVASGKVNLKPMISKEFSLAQANDAFAHMASGQAIKVLIRPNL